MRLALLLALLVAGCADGVTVSRTYYRQRGIPSHADLAAAQPETRVALRNSPFADSQVLAAMRVNNPRPHMNFAIAPASDPYGYRIVVGFGARPAGGSYDCAVYDAPSGPPPTGKTEMYGAFCVSNVLLSEAVVAAPAITSADDPIFARMTGDLLGALLPTYDPLAYQSRCRFPFC